jgi:3-hydroxy-4-methylanthranilate adenylyltransferase
VNRSVFPNPGGVSELADLLLKHAGEHVSLSVGIGPETSLTEQVERQALTLGGSTVERGEAVAVRVADPRDFLGVLLALWRIGVVPLIVDHRLSEVAYAEVLEMVAPVAEIVDSDTARQSVFRRLRHERSVSYDGRVMLQLTSGTTGRTRVVHRDLSSVVVEIQRYMEMPYLSDDCQLLAIACSPFHTYGLIAGLLSGVAAGKDLAFVRQLNRSVLPPRMLTEPQRAALVTVPSILELLSHYEDGAVVTSLGYIIFAGERPSGRLLERIGKCTGKLSNIFGTTETGLLADSVGRLDELVPCQTRELRVRGGRVEVKMPEDPYLSDHSGERWSDGWFWTGDIADVSTGGVEQGFCLMGRSDSQVSIGGLKINLSRVEDAALETGMCRAAVACFVTRIDLYVEIDDSYSQSAFAAALRDTLEAREFPSRIHYLKAFPRTFGGKCLRDPRVLSTAPRAAV